MAEVTEEEPTEDEDAALEQQQTAAVNVVEPGYDEDFEDNLDDLAAALKTARSSLGTAAALATVAARDADPLLAAAAVQQQPPIRLQQQQQQQQPQLQHQHTHSHADNACEQQAPGIAKAGSSSPKQLAQLLTQVSCLAPHSLLSFDSCTADQSDLASVRYTQPSVIKYSSIPALRHSVLNSAP